MGILLLQNIGFSYGRGEKVLQGLEFEFEKGKVYAIVGRSGAGKIYELAPLKTRGRKNMPAQE